MKKIYKKPYVLIKNSNDASCENDYETLKASEDMLLREIAGEALLVPVGALALRVHGIINLSESGKFIWEKLREECTEQELVNAILLEYDIDQKTAEADVKEFIGKLDNIGIIYRGGKRNV